jgi:ribosome maturation factor RimP
LIDLQQTIEEIAAPFLGTIDAFIVDIHIVHSEQRKVLQLFVDTDSGITIGQCTELNRKIGEALELQNIIQNTYVLEVSSPDLTKPLKLLRQFRKNIGRRFRVRYRKDDGVVEIVAKLEGIEGDILNFITKNEEVCKVTFNEIIESIEELPW